MVNKVKPDMRNITDYDLAAGAQLKRMYQLKKRPLDLTQQKLADKLNVTQGYIAQCFNGHTALDLSAILKFAEALQVRPQDIDPNFERRFPQASGGYNPARIMETLPLAGVFMAPELSVERTEPLMNQFPRDEYCLFKSTVSIVQWAPAGTRFMVATRQRAYINGAPALLERRSGKTLVYTITKLIVDGETVKTDGAGNLRGDRLYPIVSTQFL